MARTKLRKIQGVVNLENVFVDPLEFKNALKKGEGKIVLELACGYGQSVLNMAQSLPEQIFVGMDRKGDRIWQGANMALEQKLFNVLFINGEISQLQDYFDNGEVDEIWITFPDPFVRPSRARHRLTSPKFLEIYKKVLRPGGKLHLKTDNRLLFDYSLATLPKSGFKIEEVIEDVHGMANVPDALQILTHYEQKFMKEGVKIKYLRGQFL